MKNPTRISKRNTRRTSIYVVRSNAGWSIRRSSSGRASAVYSTQKDALQAARELMQAREGGEITLHGRDGRIRGVDTYALGAKAFGKLSAIEGMALTKEMQREFENLDRQKLSPAERRRRLIAKFSR